MLVGVPCRAVAVAHYHAVVGQAYAAVKQHVAVTQVDYEAVATVLHVGVTVVGHAAVGRQLDDSARQKVVIEHHLVVSGACRLVLVLKVVLVSLAHVGSEPQFTHFKFVQGHQQHVTVILAAGTAEVGVAEAEDGVVAVVVAAAAVPSAETCIGRGLYLSEGHDGAGEGVTVAVGSHQGVDIRGQRLLGTSGKQQQGQNPKQPRPFSHLPCREVHRM